jgi:hypothetical protein
MEQIPGFTDISGTQYHLHFPQQGWFCWVADAKPGRIWSTFPDTTPEQMAALQVLLAAYAERRSELSPAELEAVARLVPPNAPQG